MRMDRRGHPRENTDRSRDPLRVARPSGTDRHDRIFPGDSQRTNRIFAVHSHEDVLACLCMSCATFVALSYFARDPKLERKRKMDDKNTSEDRDVKLVLPDGAEVASTAFVGVCDVSGAGCACVSNVESERYRRRVYDVGVVGMKTKSILRSEGLQHPVQLCNFCDEAGCPVVSLLAVNTTLENKHFHLLFALALSELLQECEVVLLVSGTILPPALRRHNVARGGMSNYEGTNPYAMAVSKLPSMPPRTPIADELLASLMHIFIAVGRPMGCVFVTGYREPYGGVDEEAVQTLGEGMAAILGPQFHMCCYSSKTLTRWNDEDERRATPYIA